MIGETSSIVESAIDYGLLGWKVYPIQPPSGSGCSCRKGDGCPDPGKHPHYDLGGLKSTSSDPVQLRTIFSDREANLGLICSESFWVLDCDGPEGIQALEELVAEFGDLPRTPVAETGGGGLHVLFQADPRIKKRTKISGRSIDSIAGNQAIVAPPSLHVSGKRYRWRVGPENASLAVAPPWLVDFVTRKERSTSNPSTFRFEDRDLRTAPGVSEGDRNSELCRLVGSHLASEGATPDLLRIAVEWGRRCNPPIAETAVEKSVGNLVAKHLANSSEEEEADEAEVSGGLSVISFAEIEARPIDWLWPGRLAIGKLSLLTGDGGVGKSLLTCDLASRISRGETFPDGAPGVVGDSFFVGSEDGAEDTIKPRLDAAGALANRVHLIRGPIPKGEKFATPVDLSRHISDLDRLLERYPEARLLVIDPVMDYLGATCNSDRAQDVRRVLSPLRDLAERRSVAIILMNHLRKSSGGSSKSRSLGSGAFVAVCRFEFRVVEDPEDSSRRLFLGVKQNLGNAPGLAFRIEGAPNGAGFAIWEKDPVALTIGEVEADSGSEDDRGSVDEAVAWLEAFLSDGPVKASEAKSRSAKDGIRDRTLNRAKKKLKVGTTQKDRCWWWSLPGKDGGDRESEDVEKSSSTFRF